VRILYTVQRYGEEIIGGSESACRLFAEQLVSRGHEVHVLTSTALSYVTWANHYPQGTSVINGVVVHRLSVQQERQSDIFAEVHEQIMENPGLASLSEQRTWAKEMGPVLDGHVQWLREHAQDYDAVVFMTYMYSTATVGIPSVYELAPIVFQPTSHDEPSAHLPMYRAIFSMADAFVYFTEEEQEVVERLYSPRATGCVIGIGMPTDSTNHGGKTFREKYELNDDPYLLYVGRVDVFKGVSELIRYFVEYKGHHPGAMKLVLAGESVMEIPKHPDIRHVGFLDESLKRDAIAGSVALVQPSPFESFSIVLCEAWLQSRPVLVQGASEVMVGQVRRSQGGLPYHGFAEFDGCLQWIYEHQDEARHLGENGRQYVVENYNWSTVIEKFESVLEEARASFHLRVNSSK
jgi:glycosyltransferase involved in cell wall biosynthesis